jgi:hypothetical protein
MATSGSYNFSVNRNELISDAFRAARILGQDQTPTSDEISNASRTLNMLVKQWQGRPDFARGLKVFSRKRLHLFLAKGQQKYSVGPASGDARCTETYGRTTVSSAYASGTSLSVTALTDTETFPGSTVTMTASDIIGVQLDDGTISWTTISAAASSPITLGGALAGAAAAGNYVWWFTSRAQAFVDWEAVVLRDENRRDTPLGVYRTVADYEMGVADKYADGDPASILIEPKRITTDVTLDAQPSDVTKQIVLTVFYPAEDYDSASDDIAYPQTWFRALKYQLAIDLCPEFGAKITPELQMLANESLAIAQNANPEESDESFQPEADGHA